MKPLIYALIPAAGTGTRMGGGLPKQYQPILGASPIGRVAEAFAKHPAIDGVCFVIHPDYESLFHDITVGLDMLPVAYGGATRQESVRNGLEHLAKLNPAPTHVLVHDAARCLIDPDTISRVVDRLQNAKAVVPTLPIVDTLKAVNDDFSLKTVPRENMHIAQTPQGFDFQTLLALHRTPSIEHATDDAALAEAAGLEVAHVRGDPRNFKLTTEDDRRRAEDILFPTSTEFRTGLGVDVHGFVPFEEGTPEHERKIWLCGVEVEHPFKLEGHSDADVGLHALVDAILGALGEGDIGEHFPPSDPQWKGANSARFVEFAAERIYMRQGKVTNIDVTLICEAPKIAPGRIAMVARIADLLDVSPRRINVKATTTEKLGFTGRREGIMAQVTVTLELPRSLT